MNPSNRYFLLAAMLVVATLTGCAAKRPAPVSDARPAAATQAGQAENASELTPGQAQKPLEVGRLHTIQRGDTLISIALANGLDYRELAAWNNIVNPNVIKLGEVLRLTAPGAAAGGP